jgi:hypothetical protein
MSSGKLIIDFLIEFSRTLLASTSKSGSHEAVPGQ